MSLACYSTCRIQFIPRGQQNSQNDYSERSIVQLMQHDFADYSIQALDIENNRTEIFNIPLKHRDTYQYGQTPNDPDQVHDQRGTYQLWIGAPSRTGFHEALEICFEQLSSINGEPSPLPAPAPAPPQQQRSVSLKRNSPIPPESTPQSNRNDILADVYELGEQIRSGHVNEAVELARKLAQAHVQLKASPWNKTNELAIPIKVRIDGSRWNYNDSNEELTMSVYPSTKIRELRAVFESSHKFLPVNQYFFVNGHLAHEDSNNMDIEVYGKCRIQYVPNDQRRPNRDYSDRSQLQLIYYAENSYSLTGIDVANNNSEIFNFPLKSTNQYKYGQSRDEPDELRSKSGFYRIWLNSDSRDHFHEKLRQTYRNLSQNPFADNDFSGFETDVNFTDEYQASNSSTTNDHQHNHSFNDISNAPHQPQAPHAPAVNTLDLLLSVHGLGELIESGDTYAAAQLATQLALTGVRLRAKPSGNDAKEQEFLVYVRLDGNKYSVGKHGATIPVHVFPSTTVRELRAVFELSHQSLPSGQYLFVNGHLAHDDDSMSHLRVGPNTVFVLFELTRTKGPWNCWNCNISNPPNDLVCCTCSAARVA
ncbi:unnamed protein product [Adineta ricciae]|uniref:RanBP2-type domain-containing protein n=1 Tax=Adineta ricciae TaxID=249248 RepID=A0A814JUM2_ADIRI|nr:unnamed protein product [Adineta ricciae]CAF1042160.1 unnamed protein product [Adineta ricciae]